MRIIEPCPLDFRQLRDSKTGILYAESHLISESLGARQVFVARERILPHCQASAPHRHPVIEEIIFVCKGKPTLVFGEQSQVLKEGTWVYFDPRDREFHQFKNDSEQIVETITFSIKRDGDRVLYNPADAWTPPTLTSERLVLRPIGLSDAPSIFAYARNPNVCRFTLWEAHQGLADSQAYILDYVLPYYAQGVPEPLGITLKDTPEKVIGTVGCFWTSKSARAMELAYAIGEEYWGRGLVFEAADALMAYCQQKFAPRRIQARCKRENLASTRVMQKLGLIYEGTLRASVYHRDRYWDMDCPSSAFWTARIHLM